MIARLTEGHIHVAARLGLRALGWSLIAGQFPGGSDDELYACNVMDPLLARDDSPDPRRHSFGKLVPDLIAVQGNRMLVVEAKVQYSSEDRAKLVYLLSDRRNDFVDALRRFARERGFPALTTPEGFIFIPALAFSSTSRRPWPDGEFAHLLVDDLEHVRLEMPSALAALEGA